MDERDTTVLRRSTDIYRGFQWMNSFDAQEVGTVVMCYDGETDAEGLGPAYAETPAGKGQVANSGGLMPSLGSVTTLLKMCFPDRQQPPCPPGTG